MVNLIWPHSLERYGNLVGEDFFDARTRCPIGSLLTGLNSHFVIY